MAETSIKKRIAEPMTNFDLEKYLGINPSDLIKYSELSNYKSIEELLPEKDSFKVLLIEDKYNSGHFVGLFRFDKTIEYFNSYGEKYDTDWRFIPKMVRRILGQATNDLTRLFKKAKADGFNVVWNSKKLQELNDKIQTCGRYVVMRRHLGQMGFTKLEDFIQKLDDLRNHNKKKDGTLPSYDWVVSKYID
jgi:hypothetical protein